MQALKSSFQFIIFVVALLGFQPSLKAADSLPIDSEQRILAEQFGKLEELFIRLAELEGSANPTRANLLQQAAQLSKQLSTQQRLAIAVDYLNKGQFTRALQEQEAARDNLRKLLELLQRENRSERLRDDRKRVEELIKEVQRISRLQRSLRGRTEAGQKESESSEEQKSLEAQTGELSSNLEEVNKANEPQTESDSAQEQSPTEPNSQDADAKESDGKKTDGQKSDGEKSSDKKPADSDAEKSGAENKPKPSDSEAEGKKSDAESKESDMKEGSKSGESGEKSPQPESPKSESPPSDSPSQGSEGQKSESQPSEGQAPQQGQQQGEKSDSDSKQQPQPQNQEQRAQQRVQQAQKRMQKAVEELQKQQRKEAVEEQKAAEQELAQAVEELERFLKQMREEEIERSLADLESRFRRMLTMQTQIVKDTEKYSHAEGGIDARQLELQAIKLAIEERKVLIEGQRAMLLLEEEGSSMAFPEAVEQINSDLAIVIEMFNNSRIDKANVDLQQQVISTLEELIESLTATQKENEKKKKEKEQQQSSGGSPPPQQDQALVDALAELRLIRTLQMRINKRTLSLAEQANKVDDPFGYVEDPLLSRQVRELAERQSRIENVMRQIILEAARK